MRKKLLVIILMLAFLVSSVLLIAPIQKPIVADELSVISGYTATSDFQPTFNLPFLFGWKYSEQIALDHTKVAGDQSNFPVLIKTIINPSHAQPNGDDILFTIDNSTKLNHEIESYNSTTGELIAWVNIPFLSSINDTILYMYYGNPSCSSQQNKTGVWSSDYVGVYHVGEGGTGTRYDSTSNGYDVTPQNYDGAEASTGKIDGCDNFSGKYTTTPDFLMGGTDSQYLNSDAGTYSAWIYVPADGFPDTVCVVSKQEYSRAGWILNIDGIGAGYNYIENQYWGEPTDYWVGSTGYPDNMTLGAWNYIVVTRGMSGDNIYMNGREVTYQSHFTGTDQFVENGNGYLNIGDEGSGAYESNGYYLNYPGMIDEARVSLEQKSPDWILTEYNNQNDPSSFATFGSETELPIVMALNPPIVTTLGATGILSRNATLNGYLNDSGYDGILDDGICYVGFQYGLTTLYGNETAGEIKTTGEYFSVDILGLSPLTTYHFRTKALNTNGTSYGEDMNFSTVFGPPTDFSATIVSSNLTHLSFTQPTGSSTTPLFTLWHDGFENCTSSIGPGIPSNWSNYDLVDGDTWLTNYYNPSHSHTGNYSVERVSFDSPGDAWLITNQQTVPGDGGVGFSIYDCEWWNTGGILELWFCSAGNTPSDFLGSGVKLGTVYLSTSVESGYPYPQGWSYDNVSTVAIENQTGYFAVRDVSDTIYDYVFVDDFTFPDGSTQLFEGTPGIVPNWTIETLSGSHAWDAISHGLHTPYILPYNGSCMIYYPSWTASAGSESRISQNVPFNLTSYPGYELDFYMYHETYLSSSDRVIVQASTDGTNWSDVQTIYRYDGTDGWKEHTVDISAYSGDSTVYIAFFAYSDYGNDMYIDNVSLVPTLVETAGTQIQMSTTSQPMTPYDGITVFNNSVGTTCDVNTTPDTHYYFSAFGWLHGSWNWSLEHVALDEITPPLPPSNPNATQTSTGINVSWVKGSEDYYTYVARNTTDFSTRDGGTMVYNGTGSSFSDSNITSLTKYYYDFWSYNATTGKYSLEKVQANCTTINSPDVITNEPTNITGTSATLNGYLDSTGKAGGGSGVSLYFDDGVGVNGYQTLTWAIYFSPTDLIGYNGRNIVSVSVYDYVGAGGSLTIDVYADGSTSDPGILTETQTVTQPAGGGWTEYTLGTPVTIDETHYIWIAVTPDGSSSVGWDSDGTTTPWKTDLFNYGSWDSLANNGYYYDNMIRMGLGGISSNCTTYFEWGTTMEYGNTTDYQTTGVGTTFNASIGNLSIGNLYHYRAVADNGIYTSYGNDTAFFTKPIEPSNLTAVFDVEPSGSVINLSWTKGTGEEQYLLTHIERNTVSSWVLGKGTFVANTNASEFTDDFNPDANTQYFYQAWAYLSNGSTEQYSDNYSSTNVTTGLNYPQVTTLDQTDVYSTSAVLNGRLTKSGTSKYGLGWSDNFDSYSIEEVPANIHYLNGDANDGGWKGWDNNSGAGAHVRNELPRSSPYSVRISAMSDLVHEYSGYTSGHWTYTAWQWIPSDFDGQTYFILLNKYVDGGDFSNSWSLMIRFDSNLNKVISENDGANLPLITGRWVELRTEINLDTDSFTFYYDGNPLITKAWTATPNNDYSGTLNIGAVDLFANGATDVFYDDMSVVGYIPGDATVHFEWGPTTSYGNTTSNQSKTEGNFFNDTLFTLAPGTLYHYRAVANNSDYTNYGADKSFFTKPGKPTGFTATVENATKINLAWTKGIGEEAYLHTWIERSSYPYGWAIGEGTHLATVSGDTYQDTVLENQTYYYQVWTLLTDGNISLFSDDYASAHITSGVFGQQSKGILANTTPLAPNWDINQDGTLDVFDVSILVLHYAQTGPPHWIRADIVPDGSIDVFDVSALVTHYAMRWLIP